MRESEVERRIERTRQRLGRLRERAERDGNGPELPLTEAIEELEHALEELSVTLEGLSAANEELAEARLAAEEHARRYLELFRSHPDAYVVTDERGVIRELNDLAEQKLGHPARCLSGRPLLALVAPSDRDSFLECLSALQQRRGRLVDREIRFGSDGPFAASVSAVSVPRNGDLEIRWMLRDATEPKERDAFRDQIERNLEAVVWLQQLDPLRMLHASPVYEVIWGRPLSSLYQNARDWIEHVHPDDRSRVEAGFERLLHGESFDAEYRILRPDGEERWIHDRGAPLKDGGGRLNRAAGLAEDVTERKAAEAALRESENRRVAAVLAAEGGEARERRSLARDLHDALSQSLALARTKLAALRDLIGGSDAAGRLREIESIIAEADERTRTLTFRLNPPILHDLGLAPAAEWLAEDLQRRFSLRVHVSDNGLPEPLPTEIRESLFRSLRELLINVARHAQTDKASVRLAREGDELNITVEDEGAGFDVSRSRSVGFGLMSVRERVEALGGRLEIHSEVGRGTRAHLVVPIPGED